MHLIEGGSVGPADLSDAASAWLIEHFQVRIAADLDNPASPTMPTGAVDYRLEFMLRWQAAGPDAEFPDLEAVVTSIIPIAWDPEDPDPDILVEVVLGGAELVIVNVTDPDLVMALDARSSQLLDMHPVLFDDGDIVQPLLDDLSNGGASYAILVGDLTVEPHWRDTDIATLGLGLGLAELARGCAFAAIDTRAQDLEFRAAAELGFKPFANGISILDLGLTTLQRQIASRLHSPS